MKTPSLLATLMLALSLSAATLAQDIPEEARRHMIRGRAAVEMAKAPEQYRMAIVEFEQAIRLAPHWADAHYNLASVQAKAGDTHAAIAGFKRYLELAPGAPDAQKVRDEIIKLEYQLEVKHIASSLAGKWSGGVQITVNGTDIEVIADDNATVSYRGVISGDVISGTRTRKAFVNHDRCEIPEERAPFRAQISADRNIIEVTYEYTEYKTDSRIDMGRIVANSLNLFATKEDTEKETVCASIGPAGTKTGTASWYRPGMIGLVLGDAGRVERLMPGGPAELAGLRAGDRIVSVDGKAVAKDAKSWQVGNQIAGPAERPVVLAVTRAGAVRSLEFTVTRRAGEPPREERQGLSASGCFIATAAYGSYLDPQVQVLREFRDRHLLTNSPGRAFAEFYYRHAPPIAEYIAERPALRAVTRWALTPLVYAVREPLLALLVALAGVVGLSGWARRQAPRAGAA
jgi:hypothetical protein